jgi:hypothetical protein
MYKGIEIGNKLNNIFRWLNPFHYWRLIFGDKRNATNIIKHIPKRKIKN